MAVPVRTEGCIALHESCTVSIRQQEHISIYQNNCIVYLTPIASTMNKASGWFPGGSVYNPPPQYIVQLLLVGSDFCPGVEPPTSWQIQPCLSSPVLNRI